MESWAALLGPPVGLEGDSGIKDIPKTLWFILIYENSVHFLETFVQSADATPLQMDPDFETKPLKASSMPGSQGADAMVSMQQWVADTIYDLTGTGHGLASWVNFV